MNIANTFILNCFTGHQVFVDGFKPVGIGVFQITVPHPENAVRRDSGRFLHDPIKRQG